MLVRKVVKFEEKSDSYQDFDGTLSTFRPLPPPPPNRFGKVTPMVGIMGTRDS